MLSERIVMAVLERKSCRRTGEYVVLLAIQGFFVGAFTPVVEWRLAVPLAALALGSGVTLAWLREQRRLLMNSYQRLALEASEIFLLLGILGLSALVAHWLRLSLVLYQAHLSYVLFGYLLGSLMGERGWRRYVLRRLPWEERYRYVKNLSPSLIFPYSWHHFRQLWSRKPLQK